MNIVKKFGGKFLKDSRNISAVVSNIVQDYYDGHRQIIVVAAMHNFSAHIEKEISKLPPDYTKKQLSNIFSYAEYKTACLVEAALIMQGIKATVVRNIRGSHLDETDKYFGKRELNLDIIDEILEKGAIPIVSGYQGIGTYSEEDTQGRYGAAATATAIAGAYGYDCILYGNTDGIYTMKPKEGGKLIKEISYEEAMEMTALVKSDLESRAIEIAEALNVKLMIGKDLENKPKEGTTIMSRELVIQEGAIRGIAVADNVAIFTLENIPFDGDIVSELFEVLADIGVDVDAISQQTTDEEKMSIFFSAAEERIESIKEALSINPRMKNLEMQIRENLALVSLVGVGMVSTPGIAAKVFRCLADNEIKHYNITTSEITISTAVDMWQRDNTVVALAKEFDI